LNAALGTSRLVSTLDDPRDAIRNAGLLLLADLTQSSTELQKLVAFEGTFEKIFQLVQQEGGLQDGGIVIQDCLDVLANLVRQNSSNQSLFRESGCVSKLAAILKTAHEKNDVAGRVDDFPNPQMVKNLWGFLAVIRLFLVHGSVGTNINQKAFEKHSLLQEILDLAFRPSTDPAIRTEVGETLQQTKVEVNLLHRLYIPAVT
jgi:intracellular protein transport protein USO1